MVGSKGYIVVVQDVRGQGSSGGVFKGFSQEPSDTSETHQWVRSLKECNGKLGLYGFSYQGLTQLTGTKDSKPPDCLSPAMTGIDLKIIGVRMVERFGGIIILRGDYK